MQNLLNQYSSTRAELKRIGEVISLFNWDLRARAPKASLGQKLEIIRYYSAQQFAIRTSEKYGELLEKLSEKENLEQLSEAMQATVKKDLREYRRFKRVPADFYSQMVVTRGKCEKVWEQAKKDNDWASFEPWLEKNLAVTKEYASYMEPEQDPYDTLLAQTQEGMSCDTIDALFTDVKNGLLPILKEIQDTKPAYKESNADRLNASSETIQQVQHLLLEYVGFDFSRGAVGESAHALTSTIDRNDVRITNGYSGRNPIDIMFSAIHEGGHGLYGQNTAKEYYDTAWERLSYADIHESQSRFLENTLGRNIHFWMPIKEKIEVIYPDFASVSLEDLDKYVNRVQLSEVRTAADELTYCLHIILRFELEKMMFRENTAAKDLRDLWNEKTKEMFGFYPSSDSRGILQDLHWSSVYFGYFPSYLLGSIYDGHFLQAAERDLGDIDDLLENGQISRITEWMKQNIHACGSRYNAPELIQKVCGREISADPMLAYFRKKHLG